MSEVLSRAPSRRTTVGQGQLPVPSAPAALRVTGLSKRFGQRIVLDGIDIELRRGEFLAVVGHSGCGKSTLLRSIAGLERPSAGQVTLRGEPVREADPRVRIMFQDARLLPWKTVLGNVVLGLPRERRPQAIAALEEVGLDDRLYDYPASLSGGQRQRVALARALVSAPELLLLDEPLGALDALTRIEMQDLIERVWFEKRFTALLVTHDVAEAVTLADRVIMIEAGRVALDVPIPLSRPREATDPDFAAIERLILSTLLTRRRLPALPRAAATRELPPTTFHSGASPDVLF